MCDTCEANGSCSKGKLQAETIFSNMENILALKNPQGESVYATYLRNK